MNLMNDVNRIAKAKSRGWPDGTTELHREIPKLLARIAELENVVAVFARVWKIEQQNNPNMNLENALANVYVKHCKAASDVIDPAQAVALTRDDFFSVPAE